jgi:hypothetical protein
MLINGQHSALFSLIEALKLKHYIIQRRFRLTLVMLKTTFMRLLQSNDNMSKYLDYRVDVINAWVKFSEENTINLREISLAISNFSILAFLNETLVRLLCMHPASELLCMHPASEYVH